MTIQRTVPASVVLLDTIWKLPLTIASEDKNPGAFCPEYVKNTCDVVLQPAANTVSFLYDPWILPSAKCATPELPVFNINRPVVVVTSPVVKTGGPTSCRPVDASIASAVVLSW